MTKENFINKWASVYNVNDTTNPYFIADLEAVIATEIAKAKVQPQPSDKVQISKHTLVEVNRAFRALKQDRNSYIHKVFSDDGVFDAMEEIRKMFDNYFVEQPNEQPELNPIEEAYERGEKIKSKTGKQALWYQKLDENYYIDNKNRKEASYLIIEDIRKQPEEWELYTEPEQVAEPAKQPAKPFDRDRFERIFCSVVANGGHELDHKQAIELTEEALEQLDAYYASKEGGENGI